MRKIVDNRDVALYEFSFKYIKSAVYRSVRVTLSVALASNCVKF